MKQDDSINKTISVDPETLLDSNKVESSPAYAQSVSRDHLIKQFQSIVEDQAIFYPAAYRFTHELGRGQQAIVFQGMRHGARGCITRHAIKLFDPSIYDSPGRYWTDMGRIASQISKLQFQNSPHLVSREIYEEYNGIGYSQMEVVDGIDLHDMLNPEYIKVARYNSSKEEWNRLADAIFRMDGDRISIQPGIALYILRNTLRGLESLHSEGFLHSDVKPSNIMISRSGYVKIIDFGRATRIREKSGILFGTPAYMSPEAHRREPCDFQSDLFSVGILALHLLCGQLPDLLRKKSETELIEAKMTLHDRLNEILPDHVLMNYEFVALLQRFLHPDPEKRFRNAEQAESGRDGLQLVHKQLTLTGQDSEYGRELQRFINLVLKAGE